MTIRQRLRSALWRVPLDVEVHDELAHHIELRARELVERRGLSLEQARAEATRRFGDVQRLEVQLKGLGYDRNRTFARREWLGELRQDIAFAWRQCRLNPGFTLAAVLTLALGIGATTAIFSVVHAVVLQPFPFRDPDRVLQVLLTWRNQGGTASVGNYDYVRSRVTSFEHLAATNYGSFNLADEGNPERLLGLRTTANYFAVFGIAPLHGRTYVTTEDRPGADPVVVLTSRLWQRRFGGDRQIVGRSIRLNGRPYTVIGIMPPVFDRFAVAAELFVPIAFTPAQLAMFDEHYLELSGLRRAEIGLAQVNEELSRVAMSLARDHPEFNRERGAHAVLLSETIIGNYRTRLYVLLGAVILVLAIACANVANLLLARLAARSRELAVRAAIGAGRGRIVRQVLTESLVLAALGGLSGLVVAYWTVPVLIAVAPEGVPRLDSATLDSTVVLAALTLVVASTLLIGLLPAWQTSRHIALRESLGDGKGTAGAVRAWTRQMLIAGQAALVVVVLGGAALLVRSAINLQAVPIGFDTMGVLTARVALPAAQYAEPERVKTAFQTVLANLQSAQGVELAALDSQPPLGGGMGSNGLIPEGRALDMSGVINSRSHFVTPSYFSLLRVSLRAGRMFTDRDQRSTPLVMIVNETLAREAFPGQDPLGKRVACCGGEPGKPAWKTIVGVVADVKSRGPAEATAPEFYLPITQIPDVAWTWIGRTMNILARGSSDNPAALLAPMRQAVSDLDPSLPLYGVRTMDEGLRQTLAQARFNTMLMTMLGVSGLVLAALGIYSVVAWLVAQRTREIGLRMALGASAADVVRQVTVHGMKPVVFGLASGIVLALATGSLLQAQLFQIDAHDPLALGAAAVVVLAVTVVAGVVPATRAARIDPSRALHEG
jgi:putative ABC transport system permease protein